MSCLWGFIWARKFIVQLSGLVTDHSVSVIKDPYLLGEFRSVNCNTRVQMTWKSWKQIILYRIYLENNVSHLKLRSS